VTTKLTPNFRRMADMIDDQLVLKPLIESYLLQAKFPDRFDVTFHKAGKERKPDGWFHPSTHPEWPARMLYYYMTAPDQMEREQLSYESRMAVTMGTAVHGFIEMAIRDAGLMLPLVGTCPACQRPHGTGKNQCDEFGVCDPQIGVRGHMDGILRIAAAGRRWNPDHPGVLEFKTTNPNAGRGLADNDLEMFIAKWPGYYAQVQDYMEASGLRQAIVLIAILGYPWKLVEIQVPYDPGFVIGLRRKYQTVRDHEKMGVPPDPCCAPFSADAKACPARYVCPIGTLRKVQK
jgi:hypothetical protein